MGEVRAKSASLSKPAHMHFATTPRFERTQARIVIAAQAPRRWATEIARGEILQTPAHPAPDRGRFTQSCNEIGAGDVDGSEIGQKDRHLRCRVIVYVELNEGIGT